MKDELTQRSFKSFKSLSSGIESHSEAPLPYPKSILSSEPIKIYSLTDTIDSQLI
jgi:hypothetical protein